MAELSRVEEARAIAAAQADPSAFAPLYEAHFARIFRYLLARIRDADRAEDLTQQTFLQALAGMKRYRDRGAPYAAFLYRIAHNLLVNSYREPPTAEIGDASSLANHRQDDHDAVLVWRAVAAFPADVQDALALRFREGLTIPEIARAISKSESATKMVLSRAIAAIRTKLL